MSEGDAPLFDESTPAPEPECRCVVPVVMRAVRDVATVWYCGTCGCSIPRRWQPPPELDVLELRLASLVTYDDVVRELGEPESMQQGADLGMTSLLARVPSDVAVRYAAGPERVRQAHWTFGDLLSLVVFEHSDGSVTHQVGLLEHFPREDLEVIE